MTNRGRQHVGDATPKVAIMQPYFFPYIGYFQLISAVDLYIVYDNIKYTKKGWINRNRILRHGKEALITLPIRSGSDYLDIVEREVSGNFKPNDLLDQINAAYRKAPHFNSVYPLLKGILNYHDRNLFRFLFNSITSVCNFLNLSTKLVVSSNLTVDPLLKGQDKVLAICETVGARTYINSSGGTSLYSRDAFHSRGIELIFLHSSPFTYNHLEARSPASLSIVDVMMFNSVDEIAAILKSGYTLART